MARWLVECSFDGHGFDGWQRQPQKRTVQGEIEKILSQILNEDVHIHGSSRTDAKVHALRFYFHVDILKKIQPSSFIVSLNRMLPKDIHIQTMRRVKASFHARNQPSMKQYVYRIHLKEDPFLVHYSTYYYYPFQFERVTQAITLFEGTHRFHQFTIKPDDRYDFVRTLTKVTVTQRGQHVEFTLIGNGFMTHMVRMIVGTLLALNEGKIDERWIQDQFNEAKRLPVSFKAGPQGLYLKKVIYE
jgi:tRNA pseudouridine38-40 synthase